jgi:hypothetical protein
MKKPKNTTIIRESKTQTEREKESTMRHCLGRKMARWEGIRLCVVGCMIPWSKGWMGPERHLPFIPRQERPVSDGILTRTGGIDERAGRQAFCFGIPFCF